MQNRHGFAFDVNRGEATVWIRALELGRFTDGHDALEGTKIESVDAKMTRDFALIPYLVGYAISTIEK